MRGACGGLLHDFRFQKEKLREILVLVLGTPLPAEEGCVVSAIIIFVVSYNVPFLFQTRGVGWRGGCVGWPLSA